MDLPLIDKNRTFYKQPPPSGVWLRRAGGGPPAGGLHAAGAGAGDGGDGVPDGADAAGPHPREARAISGASGPEH